VLAMQERGIARLGVVPVAEAARWRAVTIRQDQRQPC
jgi:hypothetical protein